MTKTPNPNRPRANSLAHPLSAAVTATLLAATSLEQATAQNQARPASGAQAASSKHRATATSPQEVLATLGQAVKLQGQTTLRFLRLPIYDARLWSPATQKVQSSYATTPFALELQYRRRIEGKLIAERSIVEMRRIGAVSTEQAQMWQAQMERAFPNVAAGDRITGVHDGKGGVRFYHNGRSTAQWQDARFANLFFGIWLSEKTPEPKLRLELLGQS